ncbi:MAG TPA: 5-dehydro-2-deoxygluconokinase [Candidatus Xenobia bacterium]|jgi:5-dehydro-2-deoxygluconokinase
MRPLDLISVGRCMVDLYCDQVGSPVAQGQSLSMYIGGCPTNVAVGARRQGLKVAMLTRVGAEATGEFVKATFEREGVDVSHIKADPEHRTPMVVAGIEPPSHFPLTWYRERTADLAVTAEDFDDAFIGSSQAVLISGNSLSTEASARMVAALVETARRVGTKIVYDIDFRPVLWASLNPGMTAHEMSARMQRFLPAVDLLVGTEEEYQALMDQPDAQAAYGAAHALAPGVAVMKLGKMGALVAPPGGPPAHHPGFPVEVYNTLGAGDAFLSGFLAAWLREGDLARCARQGNASGAIVVTRHGCAPAMPYEAEIEYFLTEPPADPRQDKELNRLHDRGGRTPLPAGLKVLELKQAPTEDFIACVERAFDSYALIVPWGMSDRLSGLVFETLSRPGYPLSLHGPGGDPGLALRERPRHVGVRIVVDLKPSSDEVRRAQVSILQQVQAAATAWDRRWMLEPVGPSGIEWVTPALQELAGAGLTPDVWLLPVPLDGAQWAEWRELLPGTTRLLPNSRVTPAAAMEALQTGAAPAEVVRLLQMGTGGAVSRF